MTSHEIDAFLWFGYVPKFFDDYLIPISSNFYEFLSIKEGLSLMNQNQIVGEGQKILDIIFDELTDQNKRHVLPFSGGLDSRLILGHLLKRLPKKNITLITYGTPGTFDYEIPKQIAKKYRIDHQIYDLNKIKLVNEDLLKIYYNGCKNIELITAYFNLQTIFQKYDSNLVYWSGFLGDPLGGAHYNAGYEGNTLSEAFEHFMNFDAGVDKSYLCDGKEAIKEKLINEINLFDRDYLNYFEQLDFGIRQASWLKKFVGDYRYAKPFTDHRWIRFMLGLPGKYRDNSILYHNMMIESFPALFSEKTKTKSVLIKSQEKIHFINAVDRLFFLFNISKKSCVNKYINYIDFNEGFRSNMYLRNIAIRNLLELEQSKKISWIKPMDIFNDHLLKKNNVDHHKVILRLISLNINLNN